MEGVNTRHPWSFVHCCAPEIRDVDQTVRYFHAIESRAARRADANGGAEAEMHPHLAQPPSLPLVAHELFDARARPFSTAYRVRTRGAGSRVDPRNGDRRICISTAIRRSPSAIEAHPAGESDAREAPLRWDRH